VLMGLLAYERIIGAYGGVSALPVTVIQLAHRGVHICQILS